MPLSRDELQHLKRRVEAADTQAESWKSTIKDAYKLTLPERYAVAYSTPGQPTPPSFKEIFDSTALDAVEDFAGFISEALYPFDKNWFDFIPRRDIPERERDKLKPIAEHITERVRFLFATSNFHPAVAAANRDLAIGTKFMRAEVDPHDPNKLLFTPLPAHVWSIEEDTSGRISGVFRKHHLRARELESTFLGGTFSPELGRKIKDAPEEWVDIQEALTIDRVSDRWRYVAYESGQADQQHVVLEQMHRTSPVIPSRWSRTPGQVWGVGPTLRALPDIRTANKIVELILKNASIAVTGIWQADDDGVLNPANIKLTPGAIIPKAVGSAGLTPLGAPGRFDVAQLVLEDLRERINRAHHRVRLPERDMTAFEASERLREAQRELRGTFGQLKSEDVDPIVYRVLDLGRQMGVVPQEQVEELLSLELIGPLAQAIREDEFTKMTTLVQTVSAMFGPEIAAAFVNMPAFLPALADRLGVKSDFVKSSDEIEEIMGQMQQAAAAIDVAQQQQAAGRGQALRAA